MENKAGQLQWTKDDFGLGLHRDLSGYERYKMIGSDEEGKFFVFIVKVGEFYILAFAQYRGIQILLYSFQAFWR